MDVRAVIAGGVVVNVVLGESEGAIPCPEACSIGWLFDGTTFTPPPPPPVPVPFSITVSQAKRALVYAGLYEAIEQYVLAVEEQPLGLLYRIMWDAPTWFRSSPELATLAEELGLTSDQVDDLFRVAATL